MKWLWLNPGTSWNVHGGTEYIRAKV